MRQSGFFLHIAPAVLYVLAIFYAGSVPDPPHLHLNFSAQDKLLHLGAFFGMQLTIFRAVRWRPGELSLKAQLLLALLVTSALGALLEIWQAALPYRSAEFLDWLADTLGAGLGAALLWLVYARMSRTHEMQ
jgi:VanZ family protein